MLSRRADAAPPERRNGVLVRALTACGFFVPVTFTAGWVAGGAVQTGYDPMRQDVSTLAALGARDPWLVMTAICLTGALVVAVGLRLALDGRRWHPVLAPLLVAGGLAVAGAGAFRIDCSEDVSAECRLRSEQGLLSWHDQAHNLATIAAVVALVTAAVVVALHVSAPGSLRLASLLTAALTLTMFAVYESGVAPSWRGVLERTLISLPLVWIALLAGHGSPAGDAERRRSADGQQHLEAGVPRP